MVIYRPHRGGFSEAMAEAREFSTMEELLSFVVEQHTDPDMGPAFALDDIVIDSEARNDPRNGWHDTRYVCTRRYYGEDYDPPAPIGFCAENYEI